MSKMQESFRVLNYCYQIPPGGMDIILLVAVAPVCFTYILSLDKTGLEFKKVRLQNENGIPEGVGLRH